ncbi:hypothetical protein HPP92_007771 [Vanilla planifolia]|uniref:CRAL-TRIO domain-containing protein n=1 Tax=Vanilla planifolia TaxID=51239 RepID=A0A835RRJ9_VANPL|nr:hypothetical protein HPP92_007771 [Vanilla planifolia]
MEKKVNCNRERVEAVLQILKKQASLTVMQEKFCSETCVERFLKARGNNVKKAAKHIKAVLSWREAIGTEHLIADEFSAELAEGVAYVSGNDDEGRPVMIFRTKQDYPKFHTQKSYVRLFVFTLEVAISFSTRYVDQFVLIFDASFFRSASAFLNLFMCTLKILSDYYPGRLYKAFVVDPPTLFPYLWKGARPFVELWAATTIVSSVDFKANAEEEAFAFNPRTTSLRFDPSPKINFSSGSSSSRFSFTVSSRFDSLKPWYLSMTTARAVAPASPSLVGVSPHDARSYSFASPALRSAPRRRFPSTPSSAARQANTPRTPRPSFLQSPSTLLHFRFRKEAAGQAGCRSTERGSEAFLPFARFYRRPYDEMAYRGKMKPPLGGLVSIVSPHVKMQRRHVTHHQRI